MRSGGGLRWLVLLAALAWPAVGRASENDAQAQARALLDRGRPREAIPILKDAIERDPTALPVRWLLARAYLLDGNDAWAQRTLSAIARLAPNDCDPLLWLAWIHLEHGALDQARDTLTAAECRPGTPSDTRRSLLLAMLESHAGAPSKAAEHLDRARKADAIFEEDRSVFDQLVSRLDPGHIVPLTGRLETGFGWTSNARAGSPVDPATRGADASSPAGQLNAWLRFVAPTGRRVRPAVEAEARTLGYSAEAGRELSYLLAGARPGVLIGDAKTALLAYRFDGLLLAGGDRYGAGPLWFYDGHRAEIELDLLPDLSLFGGGGRRLFREVGRSRTEIDGGIGGAILLHPRVRLIHALTVRRHSAENPAYDLWGESALFSAEMRLAANWALRAGALAALDWYPRSTGYFQASAPHTRRRDLLTKLSLSAYAPPVLGVKAGVTYEYSERFSATDPYDYRDHRVMFKLAFGFSVDPWAPATVRPAGHVPLHHGVSASGFDERLQDLLRQNEADQRRSSCVQ
jgi:tetratricopeptide (TPR) repeat protein